jgi:hypothetical protein
MTIKRDTFPTTQNPCYEITLEIKTEDPQAYFTVQPSIEHNEGFGAYIAIGPDEESHVWLDVDEVRAIIHALSYCIRNG